MKIITLILIAITILSSSPAATSDDTRELRLQEAKRYLTLTYKAHIIPRVIWEGKIAMPEHLREQFSTEMNEYFDSESYNKLILEATADTFTLDELKALVAFYSSPIGQSIHKKHEEYLGKKKNIADGEFFKASVKADRARVMADRALRAKNKQP